MQIGELLKRARKERGLSQHEITFMLGWSSPQFLSNIERGKCSLPPQYFRRVAFLLKLPVSKLIGVHMEAEHDRVKKIVNQKLITR